MADWDGATYDTISDPQYRWGLAVSDRLPHLGPGTLVLDAGCGFVDVNAALVHAPVTFDTDEAFHLFQRTVTLRTIVAETSPDRRDQLVETISRRLGDRTLDYVRLDITATRAGAG